MFHNGPTRKHTHIALARSQTGIAALAVILVLLLSISAMTLYSANTGILEQKVSANDYRSKKLAEAADAGLDHAMAWLMSNQATWIVDPTDSDFEIDETSISTTIGNYAIDIDLRRPIADRRKTTITATATESGVSTAVNAVNRIEALQNKVIAMPPTTPLMINGCLANTTGNPEINNTITGGEEIVSSQAGPPCVDPGHFNKPPSSSYPAPDIEYSGFTGTAWENTFGISLSEMEDLAAIDSDIYWVTGGSNWTPPLDPLGSVASPVIVIFNNCQKFNAFTGPVTGIVYYSTPCPNPSDSAGWGSVTVNGSVIFEGDVAKINANAVLEFDPSYVAGFANKTTGVKNRIPGSWIDKTN